MQYFVEEHSVVRKIWGKSDTILFIFAGASAEFALNKAVQKTGLPRMFLHAWQLRFIHPAHQQDVRLQAELPQTLQEWLLQCTPSAIDNAQT